MDSSPQQPLSINPKIEFFLLLGLYLGGLVLSQVLASVFLFPFMSLEEGFTPRIDFENPLAISALKAGQFLSAIITFILPALVFVRIRKSSFFKELGFSAPVGRPALLITPLFTLCLIPLVAFLAELNSHLPLPDFLIELEQEAERLTRLFLKSEGLGDLAINLLIVAVSAAFAEEIFFRGALQPVLIRWFNNPHLGIWVGAFLFSFLHFQFLGFFPRMLLGGVLGYLFLWTGSLWIPIAAHFTNNALGVLIQYFIQKGSLSPDAENFGASATDYLWVLAGLVFAVLLGLLIRRKSVNPS